MLLKMKDKGVVIKVADIHALLDPYVKSVEGRIQSATDHHDKQVFAKENLCFLSGEPIPQCWYEVTYRDSQRG